MRLQWVHIYFLAILPPAVLPSGLWILTYPLGCLPSSSIGDTNYCEFPGREYRVIALDLLCAEANWVG